MKRGVVTQDNFTEGAAATRMPAGEKSVGGGGIGLAKLVAAGILLSRIAGLLRESIFAHYFGNSDSADAFKAAFRIPNMLQNLFGQGVLSASFIPVYSRLLAQAKQREANRLAVEVGALLSLAMVILALLGVLAAPYLMTLVAPGFHGAKRALGVSLVQILFPGAALLTLSAWCLGILNSHNRFFASYAAPVAWNAAIIAAMLLYGGYRSQTNLAAVVAWGAVIGAGFQFAVQLPQTLKLLGRFDRGFAQTRGALKSVAANFFPVLGGRGVVQISAYVDNIFASFLPAGAVAAFNYAQIVYFLPVSLFGISIAAAELPAMSRAGGPSLEMAGIIRARLNSALRHIAFLVTPSAAAFVLIGDVIVGAIFQSGRFSYADALYVWGVLAGSSVGLLAVTMGRLYSSAYYALWDTRTPLKFALVRVALTGVLGYFCALVLPGLLGFDRRWGVAGLTASAGVSGWAEFALLRIGLNRRIGPTGIDRVFVFQLWLIAGAAGIAALAVKLWFAPTEPRLRALVVLPIYLGVYLGAARWLRVPELKRLMLTLSPRRASAPPA
jgi:putative peptidoglycan lipid II flippase